MNEGRLTDPTHENTTLSIQIRVNLLLERCLVHVARTDTNANGHSLLQRFSGDVLEDGDTGVDPASLLEQSSNSATRTLGCDEDDIDILRGNDVGQVLEDDREAVREVERFVIGDERGDLFPCL